MKVVGVITFALWLCFSDTIMSQWSQKMEIILCGDVGNEEGD